MVKIQSIERIQDFKQFFKVRIDSIDPALFHRSRSIFFFFSLSMIIIIVVMIAIIRDLTRWSRN